MDDQTSDQEGTGFSGDSLIGTGGVEEAHSPGSSRTSCEEENVEFSHEKSAEHALDLGMPGKLLELMEDRDKAVHLCLQVRMIGALGGMLILVGFTRTVERFHGHAGRSLVDVQY